MATTDLRPADQATRDAALDPERSFIVQAPAGSGKTTLLVQRFLRLLARVEQPERVLAITFTRKAAAEMRRRIARAVEQARRGVPRDERDALSPDKRETLALAERVFERDQAREPGERWDLERYPARLRVMTFDALCLELASRMPVLSQFGAVPEPTEEDEPLVLEASLRILGRLYDETDPLSADVATLLDYLDNDWQKAQRLLGDMLRSRGQWRLVPSHPPGVEELERALAFSVEHFLGRVADRLPDAMSREIAALGSLAGERLRGEGSPSAIGSLAGREALPAVDDVPGWRGLAELLVTADGKKWRSSWDKRQGVPPGKEGKPLKDRFKQLKEGLEGDDRTRELLHMVRLIPDGGYDERQARVLRALHAVLVNALAEMRVVVSERGQADFTEIALRAEEALGSSDSPSELLLKLDYGIEHLLVDEFQDTSWSQYRLLARLTEGWQAGDGRTLFLVGDPMQSIYRFRDAEVGLFIDVRDRRRLGSIELEPLSLTVNFRSAAQLVDWFNVAFPRVLPARSDAAVGAVAYTPADPGPGRERGNEPAVRCHPAPTREDEAERVAALAAELRACHPDDSIAILVRSRGHLEAVLPCLHEHLETQFSGQKLEKLREHPDVCDLVALTRALLHPADRVAWLAVLHAPWCGLTRAGLHAVATRAGDRCIPDVLEEPPAFDDEADDDALARVAPVLVKAMGARHDRELRDWVETTWLGLGGPDGVHGELGLAAAAALLDELERFDEDGDLPDPPWLEQALRERFVPPDPLADDKLQVMTMHQAKGLEFDHVILPGLDRYGRHDDDPLQVWHDLPGAAEDSRTLAAMMDPPDVTSGSATVYRFVRALEKERHDYELSRLLYVACTRAGQSLHLLGVPERDGEHRLRPPDRRSLLYRLWPVVEEEFEATPAPAGPIESEAAFGDPPLLRRLKEGWEPPTAPPEVRGAVPEPPAEGEPAPVEYEWVSEPGRIAGIVVHEFLRRIATDGLDHWDEERVAGEREALAKRLTRHGLPEDERQAMTERVCRALTEAVTGQAGRWVLADRESARNEYALSAFDGGRLRSVILDRTFVDDDGARWIIDYKAGERRGGDEAAFLDQEVERYRDQLARYADIMRRLDGPDRKVKAALYYPLLGALRELPV